MAVTRTLKLKFHRLNVVKEQLFVETTTACTDLANELIKLPVKERKKLTTAKVVTPLKSALANQVIRQIKGKAGKKTKEFKLLPPEINYQNWRLFKKGGIYSVSFPTLHKVKRVPIEVKSSHWQILLDRLFDGDKTISKGTLKLHSQKGKWYALVSLTEEVPEVESNNKVGIDRGQNMLATAVPSQGFGLLFSGKGVKHRRRQFQQRRQQLALAKKYRAIKKLEQKEQRWMRAINHTISRRIVDFANWQNADLVLENLSGCRQTMKQRKKQRSDNSQSRHAWAYYDLQCKLEYKQTMNGRQVHYRPPHYTSKTSCLNGELGKRNGNWFKCTSGAVLQADFNSGRNLAIWDYRYCEGVIGGKPANVDRPNCSLDSRKVNDVMSLANSKNGVIGSPLNSMNIINGRAEQLCLFDSTNYDIRRENPTSLATA